ncbi:peptidoglycan-binding protein [Streptacidiphilus jiangxiensis]|uniref:peptidoglycan-binding protein n=1 Tax=Streptacidiphilus jiangxiensis TaxID=235985 RepID=UPI0005AB1A24|nr:peptidoglycan-binding protein [Streptacidiphilus jiangxiensis]
MDGDGRAVGHSDGSNDETTVLPPIDGDPALVRPYVRAAEPEAPRPEAPQAPQPEAQRLQAPHEQPQSAPWSQDAMATTVLPPVPAAASTPMAGATPPAAPYPGQEAPPRRAQARRTAAASAGPKRGKVLALTGGAVALVLIGTGAALLTRPSAAPSVAQSAPNTEVVPSSPSGSASPTPSPSPSARPSHSARPSASRTALPSPTRRTTPSATRAATPTSTGSSTGGNGNGTGAGGNGGSGSSGSLGPGSTGQAVVELQQDLRALHIDHHLQPTGVYDQQTAQDVIMFQACENVTDDPAGVFGPATQAAMQDALANGLSC